MNDTQRSTYIAWLNDAHALEVSLIDVLERQIEETKDYPQLHKMLSEHLEETRRHERLVASCLKRHGSEPAGTKDMLARVNATISGLAMSVTEDSLVKHVHSSYAAEHAEIATYNTIRAAATMYDDEQTVEVCDEILPDEKGMADLLLHELPHVVTMNLQKMEDE